MALTTNSARVFMSPTRVCNVREPLCSLLTELFEATGTGANAALLNTVIIGAVNVASTVVAILVVDRWALGFVGVEIVGRFRALAGVQLVGRIVLQSCILVGMELVKSWEAFGS